jgi:hypothetical protein
MRRRGGSGNRRSSDCGRWEWGRGGFARGGGGISRFLRIFGRGTGYR